MDREIITSNQNQQVKLVRRLMSSTRERHGTGLAVFEGIHLADSLLTVNYKYKLVVVAESALQNQEIIDILSRVDSSSIQILKNSVFQSLSKIQPNVGIIVLAEIDKKQPPSSINRDAILLDDVQDAGNLGTILRTCVAVGIDDVYLSTKSASAWSPKSLRAGMGAQLSLNIYENVTPTDVISKSTVESVATSLASSVNLYQANLLAPRLWVFGNEGQGVSQSVLESVDLRLKIPQTTSTVESLNVSASVAICLYEQYRQRQN